MDKERDEFTKELLEYGEKVINVINNIIEDLHNENDRNAFKNIVPLSNGMDYIIQSYLLINNDSDLDIFEINEHLTSIVEAIENNDSILVADIFNYEIKPIFISIMDDIKKGLKKYEY